MASTNKTPNYDLPQFVAQDKPTWLGDVNDAFSKIDAGMEANKSAGESVVTRVTSLEETSSQHTTQIAEVTQTANTAGQTATAAQTAAETAGRVAQAAQSTANTAGQTATAAQSTANNIANSLNLDTVKEFNGSQMQGTGCTVESRSIMWTARNAENTIGKLYGLIYIDSITGGSGSTPHPITVKLPQAFNTVKSQFNIACAAVTFKYDAKSNLFPMYGFPGCTVLTDGSVQVSFDAADIASNAGFVIYFMPCLYFLKDFGDPIVDPTIAALAYKNSPMAAKTMGV